MHFINLSQNLIGQLNINTGHGQFQLLHAGRPDNIGGHEIACGDKLIGQRRGINAVFFYAPTIFEQSGVGTNAAFAQATVVGLTNVLFTVVAMVLIDRLGRKPLLIAGLAGIIVSMSLVSYGFGQATYTLTETSVSGLEIDAKSKDNLRALSGTVFQSDIAFKEAVAAQIDPQVARNQESAIIASAISVNAVLVLSLIHI